MNWIDDIGVAELPANLTGTWQLVRLASGRDHVMLRAVLPITGEEGCRIGSPIGSWGHFRIVPTGTLVVTASYDGTARIWVAPPTGQALLAIKSGPRSVPERQHR